MKKLVFIFIAVAAISFASCGNNTNSNSTDIDTTDSIYPIDPNSSIIESEDSLNNDSIQVE